MSLKKSVYKTVNHGSTRWLIALVASAAATARNGQRATVAYDPRTGGWLQRTSGGTTLMPYPSGMSAEQCSEFAKDVFLQQYSIQPGDIVFDIGAGVGTEALPFSRMVGTAGRVVAVEAHPATFTKLERVCRLNGLDNVEPVHAAVMDSDEPVTISDLDDGDYIENKIGGHGVQVPAVTIPDLLDTFKLDRIDFLKMNIEGAEVPALRGARDVLGLVRHAAIGCHDFMADQTGDESYRTKELVRDMLVAAGFTVASRAGDPRPWAADYLFASR
ncbi:FkbM family methyltransferase [Mycolicibacterium sp. CBM1]